jgi:DNA polymerase-3 subunit beta
VGARKLIDILRSLPADQVVTLTASQRQAHAAGGKSRFTLQTLPADDFPLVQEAADFGPSFSVPQKTLKALINQVHFAMAVHDIRYYLNGILFVAEGKTLTLVATDGHRLALAQATLDVEMPKQEVILPRKTVLELQRLLKDDKTTKTPPHRDALCRQPGQVQLLGHGVRHQAGRGQVPRLQPRHPQEPQEPA